MNLHRNYRRGQLLVVTALLLATVFVGLALVTNTAIFTENLSTNAETESGAALLATTTASETIEEMLDRANAHHNTSHSDTTRQFTALVNGWRKAQEKETAKQGRSLHVIVTKQTNGTYIRQLNHSGNFTDASDSDADWALADNVSGVSDYRMTVNRDHLSTDQGDPLNDLLATSFTVSITNNTGTVWELHVYENAENNITVRTTLDGNGQALCEVDAVEAEIDLVAGTLGGKPCSSLTFAKGIDGNIDLEYHNPDQVSGTYEVRVDRVIDPATDDRYEDPGTGSPSITPNIYATEIQITYSSPDISVQRSQQLVAGDAVYHA